MPIEIGEGLVSIGTEVMNSYALPCVSLESNLNLQEEQSVLLATLKSDFLHLDN